MKKKAILLLFALLLFAVSASSEELTDYFWVTVGAGSVLEGGGSGYNGGYWYAYPSMWINQWFYDHPLDTLRGKVIHVEFDWIAYNPTCTTDIIVAINWSTPQWSALRYGDTQPPLPGVNEGLYIVRSTILDECGMFTTLQHFEYDYIIWAYNPEWVSIDVMGCNYEITNGVLVHECKVGTDDSSWGAIKANFR